MKQLLFKEGMKELSFEEVLKMFNNAVKSHAYKTRALTHFTREEREQEFSIALWEAYNGYDISNGILFSTFALTCMKNKMIIMFKIHDRKKHVILREAISTDKDISLFGENSCNVLDVAGFIQEDIQNYSTTSLVIDEIIKNLKGREKEIMILLLKGYSRIEIGNYYGVTPQRIGQIINGVGNYINEVLELGYKTKQKEYVVKKQRKVKPIVSTSRKFVYKVLTNGIHYHVVKMSIEGKQFYVGNFKDADEAIRARNDFAIKNGLEVIYG